VGGGPRGPLVAIDLGATSGRVLAGFVEDGRLRAEEVSRFANEAVGIGDRLYWDLLGLWRDALSGLREAARAGPVASVGIDGWAVDYVLLDGDGELLGPAVHYRDRRHVASLGAFLERVVPEEHYRRTGIALLPIVTAPRLAAESEARRSLARRVLLLPDLFLSWLGAPEAAEVTNASTTGLLEADGAGWAFDLAEALGIRSELLPPLAASGSPAGRMDAVTTAALHLGEPPLLVRVASHDTASAVAAVPATGSRFGYVSVGTWSLAGVELAGPVLGEAARLARFTNERGVGGSVRFLRNVMGLWLLEECRRDWRSAGLETDATVLLAAAAQVPPLTSLVDASSEEFLAAGDMPERIRAACRAAGEPVPREPREIVRCIVDSLALAHRRALEDAQRLTGLELEVVHLVGGGSRNALLCQATADACGLPVVAGPAEASALGNLAVQAQTLGLLGEGSEAVRACMAASVPLRRYEPAGTASWSAALARLRSERERSGGTERPGRPGRSGHVDPSEPPSPDLPGRPEQLGNSVPEVT